MPSFCILVMHFQYDRRIWYGLLASLCCSPISVVQGRDWGGAGDSVSHKGSFKHWMGAQSLKVLHAPAIRSTVTPTLKSQVVFAANVTVASEEQLYGEVNFKDLKRVVTLKITKIVVLDIKEGWGGRQL